ncbi:hypothetical protein [Kutzneria sp. 744]|uniref:hypothetical protein n=1 Tax=Kutzneria sp. (strain 744) TaxID=345341 RepID=UPI0004AEB4CB|nr:hypothetical protein [Kutzneria sp. 744]
MLEYSAPESIRAEVEYRQARARELARPIAEHAPIRLPKLFRRHRASDDHDPKAARHAA